MADLAALTDLFEPEAKAEGLSLVRVKMMGGTSDPTLQVMAERPDTRQLTLDDCARLSRRLSERLDALEADGRDPIAGAYRLEVSSPGIDRPLTRLADFENYAGLEAKLELDRMAEGRKRFRGRVVGVDGDNVEIDLEGEEHTALIPFSWITDAKLVMNDELMQRGAEARQRRIEDEQQSQNPED